MNKNENTREKVKEYTLFVIFSAIATLVDWLIMKLLGRKIEVSVMRLLVLSCSLNVGKILPIIKYVCSFLQVMSYLGIGIFITYSLSLTRGSIRRDNLGNAQDSLRRLIFILLLNIVCISIQTFVIGYKGIILVSLYKNAYTLSNVISYPVGVALAFYWSAKYAFKTLDHMKERIRDTILVHVTGLVVQELLLYVLKLNGKTEDYAKLVAIAVNAILMAFSSILIVFRKRDNKIVIFAIFHKEGKERRKHPDRKKKSRRSLKGLKHRLKRGNRKKKTSAWISGCLFSYIERSFFICLIQSSRNHVTLPI